MRYFNLADALNSDCMIRLICGNRSSGKSFAVKRRCMQLYFQSKKRFIYIRRTKTALQQACPTFFNDISIKFDPDYRMEYKGNKFYIYRESERQRSILTKTPFNKEVCGYAYSIEELKNIKSVVFPNIGVIMYDEFIPDDLRYSHPQDIFFEPRSLLNIIMTAARGINKVFDDTVECYCISNFVSRYNPYYTYFGVDMTGRTRVVDKKNSVYAIIDTNTYVSEEIVNSKLGNMLMNTDYGQYAVDNVALKDNPRHVLDKCGNPAPVFQLYSMGDWFAACVAKPPALIFRKMLDKDLKAKYRFGFGGDFELPWIDNPTVKWIKNWYDRDLVYYDSQRTKNIIGGAFERRKEQ